MIFGRIGMQVTRQDTPRATKRVTSQFTPGAIVLAFALLVAGCSSAPVGPGFYRVERGDTLSGIARQQKQSVSSLARWNNLSDPNQLEVGQVLRVAPPGGTANAGVLRTTPDASASTAQNAQNARPVRPAPALPSGGPPASATITLAWPARGSIINNYDGSRNKGIDIAGQAGDPVSAAAPGQVAYVGQLRGYGNLLIIKHSNGFLTSYAHLQRTLVKEGQSVSSGQAVAAIGSTEAARPMLHFELRYNGQPVNPARYLPAR
jgi:lipoprotein YgeR